MATFYNQATLSYSGGTVNSNITSGELLEVLSASKTAVVDSYNRGDTVTYVIQLLNAGAAPLTGLTVTDDLGAYTVGTDVLQPLTYVEGSLKYFVNGLLQATPTITAGPPLVVSGIGIPADGNATLVYTAEPPAFADPSLEGTIVNTATVTGGINDLTVTETINAAIGADLTITKSLSPATVTENGQLTYTFVIANYGNAPATAEDNVVITDTFDPVLSDLTVTYEGAAWTAPADYTYNAASGEFTTVAGNVTVPAATFTRNADGTFTITPGTVTLTVSGTV